MQVFLLMTEDIIILDNIIITPLIKAKQSLDTVLAEPKTDISRDASIQRFEYTFELIWKILRRVLVYKGIQSNNPRDVFRDAAKQGLIDKPEEWFAFLESRNFSTHTYNGDIANAIYAVLPLFQTHLTGLIERLLKL